MDEKQLLDLLKLIENNGRLTEHELAIMLNLDEEAIKQAIANLERDGVICGYHTLINWDKISDNNITAMVELRVTPQGGEGYQKLAEKIQNYPQVSSLYLMSGAYDFLVMVNGRSMKEIAMFVSSRLAPIDEVQSTTTHFTLTVYKELGTSFDNHKPNERMVVTP